MVYRLYSDEENKIVKVWTPETLATIGTAFGVETKQLEEDERTVELMGLTEFEYDSVVYVDNILSVCRKTSGWDSVKCQEHVENRVLYRCFFCHHKDQREYCKAINSTGRRCAQPSAYAYMEGDVEWRWDDSNYYCRWHDKEREKLGFKFSLEILEDYLEGWQKEAVMLWKRKIVKRLSTIEQLLMAQVRAIKDHLRTVPVGPLGSREYEYKLKGTIDYTYFILCDGYIKIGKSNNPVKRFETLCKDGDTTIRPRGIDMSGAQLLGYVIGGRSMEAHLHSMLFDNHAEGEWFHYDSKVAKLVDILIGENNQTVEWVLDDIIKNYDTILAHDAQGGWDFTETPKSIEAKKNHSNRIENREQARIREYGN